MLSLLQRFTAVALTSGTLLLAGCATAQSPASDQDHAAHHPAGQAGAPAPGAKPPGGTGSPGAQKDGASGMGMMGGGKMGGGDMKGMCEMHDQMMGSMTPEDRKAAMAQRIKAMSPEQAKQMMGMMEKRMSMMQEYMQMMREHMSAQGQRK